jgi:serine/threonine-protein kinase
MTETGLSLGTPHYMSPEQATAEKEITARSDVYSLGSVLYEMLAGEPPHTGGSAQQIVMKIIAEQPQPVTELRKSVPPNVAAAVGKALEKLPADRFESAKAFAEALGNPHFTAATTFTNSAASVPTTVQDWIRSPLSWVAVALAVAAGAAVFALLGRGSDGARTTSAATSRWEFLAFPDSLQPLAKGGRSFEFSPDGHSLVYVVAGPGGGGTTMLALKRDDQLIPSLIPGTEHIVWASFSPGGDTLLIIRSRNTLSGTLEIMPLAGGSARPLVSDSVFTAVWGDDGYIYYTWVNSLLRQRASGGTPDTLTHHALDAKIVDINPVPIPGGSAVLFARILGSGMQMWVLDLTTRTSRQVGAGAALRLLPGGQLVYTINGRQLLGVRFDPDRLTMMGDSIQLLADVQPWAGIFADATVSPEGSVVYWSTASQGYQVEWVNRDGTATIIDSAWRTPRAQTPALSPDGRRLAIALKSGIEVKELDHGPRAQVTPVGPTSQYVRGWLPGGDSLLVFRDGIEDSIYTVRHDGIGELVPYISTPRGIADVQVTRDRKWIVYRTSTNDRNPDIFAQPINRGRSPIPLATTPAWEMTPAVSPDGKWLAYASSAFGEAGPEIYLSPFPNVSDWRIPVSVRGGAEPRWSEHNELFYISADSQMMAVRVPDAPRVGSLNRVPLFSVAPYFFPSWYFRNYDVTSDGRRFVMIRLLGAAPLVRIDNLLADFPGLAR